MSFHKLKLIEPLLQAINKAGYTDPTSIQQQVIPIILQGKDLIACAQTGTGKTAAFTLPLLQQLSQIPPSQNSLKKIRALILAPTRELVAQVAESIILYGQFLNLTSAAVFGGVNINPQIRILRRGIDILVSTPGRLLDHIEQGTVQLKNIAHLVLDEADRMLDMGFIRDIRKILNTLPPIRQNLLFSATYSDEVKALANSLLTNPVSIEGVKQRNTPSDLINHIVYKVDQKRKRELLSFMIGSKNWKQVLIFTRTKHGANRLAQQLSEDGLVSEAIHGNKSQGARTRALHKFKQGKLRILVATDIASRGLDIDQLPHVVNFELPNVPEDYVHRIGRTGRAGNRGEAISLVSPDEKYLLSDIEALLKQKIPQLIEPGYEPISIKSKPVFNRRRFRSKN